MKESINLIIDKDLDRFYRYELNTEMTALIIRTHSSMFTKIQDFLSSYTLKIDKEYVMRKILDYLSVYEEANANKVGEVKNHMREAIDLVRVHFYKESSKLGIQLNEETFTQNEFDQLKSQLSDIAQSVFELRIRQDAAHEIIYNSVEEIREELIKTAEKIRIFDKDFVIQQIVGKLIDMTVEGGAGAVLTKMSSHYPELSTKINALL